MTVCAQWIKGKFTQMVLPEKIHTIDEFWQQYGGQPYELVDGKVVKMSPTGYLHGSITRRVSAILGAHVDTHQLGDVVGAETGFMLDDDTMRGADAAFIGRDKLKQITNPDKYLPFAPDIAVEVVSPNDTASDIKQKVSMYLEAGTSLVWIVYPSDESVMVYFPNRTSRELIHNDILDGGEILPGFSVQVSAFFPPDLPEDDT